MKPNRCEVKRLLCALVALCLMLCGAALAEAEDPVAVRVGNYSYPLSLVQRSLDSVIKMSDALSDEPMTAEERARTAADTIDNFVGIGLVESKLAEAGQHDFTDDEIELMKSAASGRYEEIWQGVYQMMLDRDMDVTEDKVSQAVADEGYDMDSIFREYEVSERQRRAIALYVPEIVLTEAELEDYYETQFLAPDRERYKDDVPRYEREVLATDDESFYTPEGYRYIRQILLEYPEEVVEALEPSREKVESAATAVTEALAKLAEVASTTDDWSNMDAPRADYDAAAEKMEAAKQTYLDERDALTLPLVQGTVDEITERYEAGIDFQSLIAKYSADTSERNAAGTGYPLHAQSEGWPEDFIKAGMALEKPGDISAPVLTEKGIHILYYAGDVPAGDHVLTDDEKELLKQSALYYRQVAALEALFEDWKKDYDIETHPELLKY